MSKMVRRGDIVIVDFAPANPAARTRPALEVQNDRDNARMKKTIVAQFTSNTSRVHADTQLLIDQNHADWPTSGLRLASAINCSALAQIDRIDVLHVIGRLFFCDDARR